MVSWYILCVVYAIYFALFPRLRALNLLNRDGHTVFEIQTLIPYDGAVSAIVRTACDLDALFRPAHNPGYDASNHTCIHILRDTWNASPYFGVAIVDVITQENAVMITVKSVTPNRKSLFCKKFIELLERKLDSEITKMNEVKGEGSDDQ